MSNLDIKRYDAYSFSIKDLNNDVNISEHKWDFIFNSILEEYGSVYFYGSRNYINDNSYRIILDEVSSEIILDLPFNKVLLKIKDSSLFVSRNAFSYLWRCFEYPSLIFLKRMDDEVLLKILIENNSYYPEIIEKIQDLVIVYTSFEPDVLWIKTSGGSPKLVRD